MFTGDSYIKSGEYVPQEYIEAEKQAIFRVSRIISPSHTEKEVLADFYGADRARVFVIPRPVKNKRFRGYAAASETVRILYIASVRRQKAHLEAVKLIEMLGRKGVTAKLNCVGSVQDASIYKECMDYAERAGIRDRIAFSGTLGQEELECAMSQSDFNISVSNWETFGRGIYEGMAFGLPTLVLARITCAGEAVIPGVKPIIAENIREMAGHIASLAADPAAYERESRRGRGLAEALSVEAVGQIMKACILDETM
ncbi:MAG: glycosyltransferase family 4 protein [Clostridium sp.]|nr:glycosyltransferase family 4 protein [Clostridium sp.]